MLPVMSRRLAIALLLPVALSVFVGGHLYLARRLVLEPLDGTAQALGVAAIALLAALIVAQPWAERRLGPPASRWITWPASLWMGAAFWLLLLLPLLDVLAWLVAPAAWAGSGVEGAAPAEGWRAALALGVTALGLGFGLRGGLAPPRWVHQHFEVEGWPAALEGFRIVQISDLHFGPILGRSFAEQLVERISSRSPDLVAVTGDLADGHPELLREELAPLAGLEARWGVFFVTGNHDHFSDAAAWVERVRELGMRPLRNERVEIGPPGARFDLVGVDDHRAHWAGGGREDLEAALAGRDPSRPAVLLAHDPGSFDAARRAGVDLQLSGHTHGGQIWPFAWFVRLTTPWVAGRFRDGRSQLYVSRGTGFWGPPLRLGSPAEITEITLGAPAEPPAAD